MVVRKRLHQAFAIAVTTKATICTVITPAHVELAALNRDLVERLNPSVEVNWNATFNVDVRRSTSAPTRSAAASSMAAAVSRLPGVKVLQGPSLEQTFDRVLAEHSGLQDAAERRRLLTKYLASYHHAEGLTLSLKQVRTRFAILMDPDFYVIRPDWISDVLREMQTQDLAAFGSPWSPRWYQKHRGFPSSHLLVLDLDRCPWAHAFLEPDLVNGGRRYASALWGRYAASAGEERAAAGRAILRYPFRAMDEDRRQRATIGAARDTGFRLMQEFGRRPYLRVGLLQPVFVAEDGFMPNTVSRWQRHPLMEWWHSPERRYLPDPRFCAREGFEAHGLPSMRRFGWEEFLWKGRPFACHVRGELQRNRGGSVDHEEVLTAVANLTTAVSVPAAAVCTAAR